MEGREDSEMKTRILWLMALLLVPGTAAYASPGGIYTGLSINLPGFGFNVGPAGVGLNIGLPWVVAPDPYYAYQPTVIEEPVAAEAPAVIDEPVAYEEAPEFIMPPELGFYVAVGIPYDLFFYNNFYYVCRGNIWYSAPYYNGPWSRIYYGDIPYVFNRFPFERIHHFRDHYYGRYQRYGAWDGFRHFRPGHHGGHSFAGRDYDRGRHDFVRPYNSGRGYGAGPAYNRPDRDRTGYVNRPAYNRPFNRDRDYGDRRALSRPYYNGQGRAADGRPAYSRPGGTDQWRGNRSTNISPFSFAPRAGGAPAYNRNYGNRAFPGNVPAYTRPNVPGQGFGNRASYYRSNAGRPAGAGNAVYTRPYGSGMGQGFNRSPGAVNRGWQGQGR